MKYVKPTISLVRRQGHEHQLLVSVHPLPNELARLDIASPSAAVLSAYHAARQALAPELVNAYRVAWKAELAQHLQAHQLQSLWLEGGSLLTSARRTEPFPALCCLCSDAEEDAGLCPLPGIGHVLIRAGYRVLLHGQPLAFEGFRVHVSRPGKENPAWREEETCGHTHRVFEAASNCLDKIFRDEKIGTRLEIREGDQVWSTCEIKPPPEAREQKGQIGAVAWMERYWRDPQPLGRRRKGDQESWYRHEVLLTCNSLDLELVFPYTVKPGGNHYQYTYRDRDMAEGMAAMLHHLLLTKTPAELLQLQQRALQVCADQDQQEEVADVIPLPVSGLKATTGNKSGTLYVFSRPSDTEKP